MKTERLSWGRYPATHSNKIGLPHRFFTSLPSRLPVLAYGNGRSYGDVCLNDGGVLLSTRGLDRFISFDAAKGLLCCEAGVTLDEILRLVVPHGWFLPVTPGTRYVTVGGAIANDVHGKNHHVAGTFGAHVIAFELWRSDRHRALCSREHETELFRATIGGLGLTGLITWAELRLRPIASPLMDCETERYGSLEDFFVLAEQADRHWEYTVAWIDCAARGTAFGRGVFFRGRHTTASTTEVRASPLRLSVPFQLPVSVMNTWTLRTFNVLYYARAPSRTQRTRSHYEPFFYPLDRIANWNYLYGPAGFLQYQCVIPPQHREALKDLMKTIAMSGTGSFLAVLKQFGAQRPEGLMSFPRAGVTLALDFPIRGGATFSLLSRLDAIVAAAGGAVYPAKDARMSGAMFRSGFPNLEQFSAMIDPAFSSSFWRRVNGDAS
jgi:FAD/FMN-containing dehydrogenase